MFGTMEDDEDDPRCTCETGRFRSRCPVHWKLNQPLEEEDPPADRDEWDLGVGRPLDPYGDD